MEEMTGLDFKHMVVITRVRRRGGEARRHERRVKIEILTAEGEFYEHIPMLRVRLFSTFKIRSFYESISAFSLLLWARLGNLRLICVGARCIS